MASLILLLDFCPLNGYLFRYRYSGIFTVIAKYGMISSVMLSSGRSIVIILKIIAIIIGIIILLFFGFFVFAAIVIVFGGEEHKRKQRCPECDKKAKYIGETVEEAGGKLSFTDAVHAQYQCRKGHIFTKTWTTRNPLG
jgi:hypothetical protein